MIYENHETLDLFRGPGPCSWCGRLCKFRDAAHVRAKGMGGGKRLDIKINLVSLGQAFQCTCHRDSHDRGEPSYEDLLAKVAAREGWLQPSIELVVNTILEKLPREPPHFELLEAAIAGFPKDARKCAIAAFKEMKLDWRRAK